MDKIHLIRSYTIGDQYLCIGRRCMSAAQGLGWDTDDIVGIVVIFSIRTVRTG